MPELPEVETVKESLKLRLNNKKIIRTRVLWDNIIAYPSKEKFIKETANQSINDVKRRGKFLLFDLDDYYLLSHLRMEGKYFFKTKDDDINKHEHVIFDLDDGSELRYMDTRKFGKMYLIKKEDIDKIGPLVKLGLEPWDDNLTSEYLLDKYKKKKLPIKSVLLDQNIIVGIGNIYADEILFLSKINPLKKCNLITKEEAENIIKYTKKVLEAAIEKGGTTIRTYSSVDGVHGLFQNELFVHGKDKNNCPICNTKIEKIKVGGRGTYYCPKCQTLQ
ncbi:MAG: DNA-formamidopyrimidine glycosylase [Candidatus Gastranaerophilaceae bacterium]|jgi:formamidopyrimidine-DNA glycosylase|nr:DNA-formamidopyrimidine glycosylase [Bacilli bacterium]